MTSAELARSIGVSTSQARRTLMKMVDEGCIEAEGANKGRYYRIKKHDDAPDKDREEISRKGQGDAPYKSLGETSDGPTSDESAPDEPAPDEPAPDEPTFGEPSGATLFLDTGSCIISTSKTPIPSLESLTNVESLSNVESLDSGKSVTKSPADRIAIPAPVIAELVRFTLQHPYARQTCRNVRWYLESFGCAAFDADAAKLLAQMPDTPPGNTTATAYRDRLVASIVMSQGGTLLTTEPARYAMFEGLDIKER